MDLKQFSIQFQYLCCSSTSNYRLSFDFLLIVIHFCQGRRCQEATKFLKMSWTFTALISLGRRSYEILQSRRFSYSIFFFFQFHRYMKVLHPFFYYFFRTWLKNFLLFSSVSVIFRVHASKRFHSKLLTERRAELFILFHIQYIFIYSQFIIHMQAQENSSTKKWGKIKIEKKLRHKTSGVSVKN